MVNATCRTKQGLLRRLDPDTVVGLLAQYQYAVVPGLIRRQQGGCCRSTSNRRNEVVERVRHRPGQEARQELATTPVTHQFLAGGSSAIRGTFPKLQSYDPSSVWRMFR